MTAPPPSPFTGAGAKLDAALSGGLRRITGSALAPYQAAVVRIGFSLTFTLFLLREWPHRLTLYGTESPWNGDLARRLITLNESFTVLIWSDSRLWFELVYHGAIVAGVMLLLGWRTRTASVLFMIGVLAVQNRSIFMGDGGDNVVHLMAIYLVFTRCGQVWSLDARRAARRRPDRAGVPLWAGLGALLLTAQVSGFAELPFRADGLLPGVGWGLLLWVLWALHGVWWLLGRRGGAEARAVADIMANVVHNGAMLIIVVEVCFVYATAGWYKIQGSRWQDGTASYYPFNLDYFTPWPELTGPLSDSGLLIMMFSYGTVIVQVAFPFTLLSRRVKNVLLAIMMAEHAGIAVLMGLPFFSLAMIAADAVFLPTNFLRWIGWKASAPARWLRGRGGDGGGRAEALAAGPAGGAARGPWQVPPALPPQAAPADGPERGGGPDPVARDHAEEPEADTMGRP
ncbi:HTTM domain-containing protein [Streptomyces capparidis]